MKTLNPKVLTAMCIDFIHLFSLQYINKASSAIRGALKEPAKRKAVSQETFSYNTSVWEAGTPSPKVAVDSVQAAGKI